MTEYIEREKLPKRKDYWDDDFSAGWDACLDAIDSIPAADVVPGSDFRDCRNELCFRCGEYINRHNGACNGCRWLH